MNRRKSGHPDIDGYTGGAVIGSDEAGYGPLAGPLVVCAVVAPVGWDDPRVNDSKKKTAKAREALYEEFWNDDRFVISPVIIEPQEIDARGAYKSLFYGHSQAIRGTYHRIVYPHLIVVDGKLDLRRLDVSDDHHGRIALPKGDSLVPECALASIVAKVIHDRIMAELDRTYPEYGFAEHMGYGTAEHLAALQKFGPCPAHRRSYGPVRDAVHFEAAAKGEPLLEDLLAGLHFEEP